MQHTCKFPLIILDLKHFPTLKFPEYTRHHFQVDSGMTLCVCMYLEQVLISKVNGLKPEKISHVNDEFSGSGKNRCSGYNKYLIDSQASLFCQEGCI